jgi:hypothetical protein
VEIAAISENYKVSANIYFVSVGQIAKSPNGRVGQVETKINVSLLFGEELGDDYCQQKRKRGQAFFMVFFLISTFSRSI